MPLRALLPTLINAGCLLALQGINAPLVAHKDGRGSTATIQIATPLMPEEPKKKKAKMGNPTRVLLLRNMVGRGDVDDDLQECGSSALPCRALPCRALICHHLARWAARRMVVCITKCCLVC